MNRSRKALFASPDQIDLGNIIIVPEEVQLQVARCRVIYDSNIRKIEFFPYKPRVINSLKLIECNDIDYSFKYDNRSKLIELFEQRGDADDILIVKNGFLTDTSIANIVFYDGERWVTPSTPLLQGTKRAQLLKEKLITEAEIKVPDLSNFSRAVLINAMLDFKDGEYISIDRINF